MPPSSPWGPALPPGHGTITTSVTSLHRPHLDALSFTYPLKLISPSPTPSAVSTLVFLLTYGGGLVSGDTTRLTCTCLPASRLSLVTQGSTKIFKASDPSVLTKQELTIHVAADAAVCLLPDPVQPFAGSRYAQKQVFRIDPKTSSLLVLDWVSEGRTARDEIWSLSGWRGRNEVWSLPETAQDGGEQRGRLLLRDTVILEGGGAELAGRFGEGLAGRMDRLGVFGTLIIRGPLFKSLATFLLQEFEALPRIGGRNWDGLVKTEGSPLEERRRRRLAKEEEDGVIWTAASVRGFVVVKLGARTVEGARNWLREMLSGEDEGGEGMVEREFGEGALLCLR
jgi:urease accessory protein